MFTLYQTKIKKATPKGSHQKVWYMNEFSLLVSKKVIRKDYQDWLYYTTAKLKKHLLGASSLPAELVKFVPLFVDFW